MKKLFSILALSIIGITSVNTYSKNIWSEAFAPDYRWACDSGIDFRWAARVYDSKEQAEKACSSYPNGEVIQKDINALIG